MGSTAAYILPNLRVGPNPTVAVIPSAVSSASGVSGGSGNTLTQMELLEHHRQTPPNVPVAAVPSPRSGFSGLASRLSFDGASIGRPSIGSRAQSGRDSVAGSTRGSTRASTRAGDRAGMEDITQTQSNISVVTEDTLGEMTRVPSGSVGIEDEQGFGGRRTMSIRRKGLQKLKNLVA